MSTITVCEALWVLIWSKNEFLVHLPFIFYSYGSLFSPYTPDYYSVCVCMCVRACVCICVHACKKKLLLTLCLMLLSVIWREVCSCHWLQDPHREHKQPCCQDQPEGTGHWRRVVRSRECNPHYCQEALVKLNVSDLTDDIFSADGAKLW